MDSPMASDAVSIGRRDRLTTGGNDFLLAFSRVIVYAKSELASGCDVVEFT